MKCEHCRKNVESAAYDAHVADHLMEQHREQLEELLAETAEDKHGVTVTGRSGIDFGILDIDSKVEFMVSITTHSSPVSLKACKMRSSSRGDDHGVK